MSLGKVTPRCADCNKVTDRCVRRHPHGVVAGSLFLCADCEYLREHPNAPRAVKLPRERAKRLQKETLLDALGSAD